MEERKFTNIKVTFQKNYLIKNCSRFEVNAKMNEL